MTEQANNLAQPVDVLARLAALLPELEFGRETHVQWRDCDQQWRDMNPSIGDSAFHANCVREYDERIAAIKETLAAVGKLVEAAKQASATLGHAYHTTLTGQLAEYAHADYQRLDAALRALGGAK